MATITSITLTYNEEKNIDECLKSIKPIVGRMIVMDGFSVDNTVEYASRIGAEVYQRDCTYYERFTYALNNIEITSDWILFIDADERLTEKSIKELSILCNKYIDTDVNGIIVKYRINFMGKELKHGGNSMKKMDVFKPGMAFLENTSLDQHMRLIKGKSVYMKNCSSHMDYKGLEHWCKKHINYARLAADDYESKRCQFKKIEVDGLGYKAKLSRIIKYKLYYKLPIGIRAWLYYIYRCYFRFGFLDGKEGRIYLFLQSYWYRYLVDIMIYDDMKKGKE